MVGLTVTGFDLQLKLSRTKFIMAQFAVSRRPTIRSVYTGVQVRAFDCTLILKNELIHYGKKQ